MITLGDTVKDKITGFEGVAIGRAEYLAAPDQYLVQPKGSGKTDFSDSYWFNNDRLETTKKRKKIIGF